MRTHPLIGFSPAEQPVEISEHGCGYRIVRITKKYDGSGTRMAHRRKKYREARIVAVADVFDALTSRLPYKIGWSNEAGLDT